jgi:uncharacterized lipoprotein YddW (UPF0748 family)
LYCISSVADSITFAQHPRGFTNKEDWRRNNVNLIIKEINETIKSVKPWVEFGISPFAIWRNKAEDPRGSDTKESFILINFV